MIKNIDLKDNKTQKIIIISIVVLAIIILFSLSSIVSYISNLKSKEVYVSKAAEVEFHDELVENSGIINFDFSLDKGKEKCLSNICITDVSISCYENKGVISYHAINNTGGPANGYLKLVLGNDEYSAISYYTFDDKAPGEGTGEIDTRKDYFGYATYEDFDLRKIGKNYRIEALTEDDINYGLTYFMTNPQNGYYEILNSGSSE